MRVPSPIPMNAATLMTMFHAMTAMGVWTEGRGTNLLDSGAPYYDVYRCADGEYISIAPIEKKFRQVLEDERRKVEAIALGPGSTTAAAKLGAELRG